MANAAANLKQMRIIHVTFVGALLLYVLAAEQIVLRAHTATRDAPAATLLDGMIFGAGLDVLVAYYFRRSRLEPALDKLRRNQNDPDALKQWRLATILSLVLALSVGLYGFALRFLGASRRVSWSFFLVALILMLLWRPKIELASEIPSGPSN